MDSSPGRRSIRLSGYDYASPGIYFVTICTCRGESVFGEVTDGRMRWNTLGLAVRKAWHQIPLHFATVDVDVFVVMPNHVHGILSIVEAFGKPQPGSVPTIVRSFKAAAALSANQLRGTAGEPAWQRGYYEHVVRLQGELGRIRRYINANPACWAVDRENPTRTRDHA